MATKEQIDAARARLEAKWDSEGACTSCDWHAALYEHGVTDAEIAEALDSEDGLLWLYCVSKDDDDSYSHRGITVRIDA